jgi:PTS system nitrogen regulatory IIA component
MNLETLVSPDAVLCCEHVTSKKRALEVISELLAHETRVDDPLAIFQLLTEREKLGSTSLGHGVALPHARTGLCDRAIGAFVKLDEGIDFDSPDQKPTDLLFALMVPEHYTDEHLKLLAGLAGLFNDKNFCQALRDTTSSQDLYKRLNTWRITSQAS